jgi:hypothetical protein
MTTLPLAARLARRQQIPGDMEVELVRRTSIGEKIKHAFQSFGRKVKEGFQKAGSAIKKGFQKFGSVVKSGFQKAGSAIKSGFQKAGTAIKSGFQKVKQGFQKAGSAIKSGFQKVGKWVKTTGAKIAKFGLKVVESVGEVVGKVVGFIPGIGKPLDRAIEGVTKIAGVISDHIHVKLPANLEKGMKVMDKADKIMGYIPRRREFSEEEAFQQRDIGETYHFEERDDNALENRDESYFERDIYERYDLD